VKVSKIFVAVMSVTLMSQFLLSGCSSPHVGIFPTLSNPKIPYPQSSARGRLIIDDGCIRLRSLLPTYGFMIGSSMLLIWPHGYTTNVVNGKVAILNDKCEIVAWVGMTIYIGGGNISQEVVDANVENPLPDKYHGPYWMVSNVIRN
jgi:hypothetical protein